MAARPVIGLLGGGQLGRMMQEAAITLGIELAVLDSADCPFRQISNNPKNVTGSFNDAENVRELARRSDILTIEIEHVNTEVLEEIAVQGVKMASGEMKKVPVHPHWETIRLIQDKYLQKEHYKKAGIPIARQLAVESGSKLRESLQRTGEQLGFPFMLKARKGSYDGRGNFKVAGVQDFDAAIGAMGTLSLYAEEWATFESELAVIVVRTEDDKGVLRNLHTYPAVKTRHEDSICVEVCLQPGWDSYGQEASARAQKIASEVVATLKGRGVYAVEMFAMPDGRILVNEVAPRPHNSGHLFTEVIPNMSQFKAHLFAVLDVSPCYYRLTPRMESAYMLNILGGAKPNSHLDLVNLIYAEPSNRDVDVFLHLYGKASKPGRKIGHITVTIYDSESTNELDVRMSLKQEITRMRDERKAAATRPPPSSSAPPTSSDLLSASKSATQSTKVINPPSSRNRTSPHVLITMGSDSDLSTLAPAFPILDHFAIPYDYTITSAHRTPHLMTALAHSASTRGIRVLIAAAGGAAHLPGMLASETPLPVIGVPVKASRLDGIDSLLSIVQMPRGCPVATVGIGNAVNAALLAVKILGVSDERIRTAMEKYMADMASEVESKAKKLEEIGWEAYLDK